MEDRKEFRNSEGNLLFFTVTGQGDRLEVRLPNNELLGWCISGETRDHMNQLVCKGEHPGGLYSNYLKEENDELTDQDVKGCLFLSLCVLVLGFIQFLLLIKFISFTTTLILSLIGGFFFYSSLRSFHTYMSNRSEFIIYLKLGIIHLLFGIITLYPVYPSMLLKNIPFGQLLLDGRIKLLKEAIPKEKKISIRLLMLIGIGDKELRYPDGDPLISGVGNPEILNILLASGFNPNLRDEFGRTMLMHIKDVPRARVLINNGANVNARDNDGLTPLMHANHASLEYIRFLLSSGADLFITDNQGKSAVDFFSDTSQKYLALIQEFTNGKELPKLVTKTIDGGNTGNEEWLETKGSETASESNISIHPKSIASGNMADVVIRVVNPYDMDVDVDIEAKINSIALFLAASNGGKIARPFEEPRTDRTIRWSRLSLPANRTGILKMTIIARGEGDNNLYVHVNAKVPGTDNVFLHFNSDFPIRPRNIEAHEIATPHFVFAVVLFFLSPIVLVLTLISKGLSHNLKLAAGRICAGALSFSIAYMLGSASMDNVELYTSFQKTEGTILDRRYYVESSGQGGRATSRAIPVAAVSYVVDSQTIYSTGFSKMNLSLDSLKKFEIGSKVDVWYNPDRPKDFHLIRQPSKGYIFLIIIISTISIILARFALMPKKSLIGKIIKQF